MFVLAFSGSLFSRCVFNRVKFASFLNAFNLDWKEKKVTNCYLHSSICKITLKTFVSESY